MRYLVVVGLLTVASSASAQTRIAFTTARAAFMDDAQKQREKAVKQLTEDFTGRAKKDKVTVVPPEQAQILVTVQSMGYDPNGEVVTTRRAIGGTRTTEHAAEHMVVELRAGEYVTVIDGWRDLFQTAEDQVGREIRRWLKDNAGRLDP